METEDFNFTDYCKSRGFIMQASGSLHRKLENKYVLQVKFVNGKYIIPVTPDIYFSKNIPTDKQQADDQFDFLQKIAGITLPVL